MKLYGIEATFTTGDSAARGSIDDILDALHDGFTSHPHIYSADLVADSDGSISMLLGISVGDDDGADEATTYAAEATDAAFAAAGCSAESLKAVHRTPAKQLVH